MKFHNQAIAVDDRGAADKETREHEQCGRITGRMRYPIGSPVGSWEDVTSFRQLETTWTVTHGAIWRHRRRHGGMATTGNIKMKVTQTDSAVMKLKAATHASSVAGQAQTLRSGINKVENCDLKYNGQDACGHMRRSIADSLSRYKAALLAYDDSRSAIQTANSTALLGVSQGDKTPTYCLDRQKNMKEY